MTASHASLLHLSASEASLKHLRPLSQASLSSTADPSALKDSEDLPAPPEIERAEDSTSEPQLAIKRENINISPEPNYNKNDSSHGVVSHDEATSTTADSASNLSESAPLKATTFRHLHQKYLAELEYMLCEFQKLERQLLGARNLQASESDGSRERREKLHSFILHLEDTIQQIQTGCESEAAGKSTLERYKETSGLAKPSKEKKEEEGVQKLEEHILANLLPVKVRLAKQLAAQQGAKHNPAGMPVRGVVSERKEGDASQFGKALDGGGSSLTQKLHGRTLGVEGRSNGNTTVNKPKAESKILYAGMAIGSDKSQMRSSLSAASSAHRLLLQGRDVTDKSRTRPRDEVKNSAEERGASSTNKDMERNMDDPLNDDDPLRTDASSAHVGRPNDDGDSINSLLSAERRRLQRKRRHKRKKNHFLHDSQQHVALGTTKRKKGSSGSKKRGPRNVEYMCALCNEVYNSTCDYNPWWALTQEECPKCQKTQIPRLDIGAPANAIEYHPALLAHADDAGGAAEPSASPESQDLPIPATAGDDMEYSDVDDSDLSDDDGLLSDASLDLDSDESVVLDSENMSPAEQAESEKFGAEYDGPKFSDSESARLLNLMLHASTCPCRHKSSNHYDVCRSAKWMMLHVRDCPGTTSTFDVCPFPWCRKTKHLLYHLVSCVFPRNCAICSTVHLNNNMKALRGLNDYRLKKQQQCVLVANQQPSNEKSLGKKPQANGQGSVTHDDVEMYEGALGDVPNGVKEPMNISSASVPLDSALTDTTLERHETLDTTDDSQDVKVQLDDFVDQWGDQNGTPDSHLQSILKDDPDAVHNSQIESGETSDSILVKKEEDEAQ
ncbi:hypothetical protein FisN_15Lh321 [Fistulifera solaris]|uniref:TAZ-type domain-containing protein n=1 Tax=Fistulifera solaris TaxID=1519565 RepID=A0A1Z5JWI9_FISSO|nr:hypothetical protein FisN_15Lh321 [Fistulifera solaris]|eukprot:GAX18384.1 hypothetical protein FisN_15Lh321 [Fistulifera solaris]